MSKTKTVKTEADRVLRSIKKQRGVVFLPRVSSGEEKIPYYRVESGAFYVGDIAKFEGRFTFFGSELPVDESDCKAIAGKLNELNHEQESKY